MIYANFDGLMGHDVIDVKAPDTKMVVIGFEVTDVDTLFYCRSCVDNKVYTVNLEDIQML